MPAELRRALVAAVAVTAAALATVTTAIPAGAVTVGTAGPNMYSPVEAGYTATGTTFRYARADVTVPGTYGLEPYIQRVEFVTELWSPTRVALLGVYNGTGSSTYFPEAAIYNPKTKALICSTWSNTKRCPSTPGPWGSAGFPSGDTIQLAATFAKATGAVHFTVTDQTNMVSLSYTWTKAGTAPMTQVRIGAEFGCTPWAACGGGKNPSYTHPASPMQVANFSDCVMQTSAGQSSGFLGAFVHHKLKMTHNGVKSPTDEATIDNLVAGSTYPGGQFNVLLK